MTRPYASHVEFRFYSGQSSKVDCHSLLQEMSMVRLLSHVTVVERVALNRKSISIKISFARDKSLPVPNDSENIPDSFGLTLRCMNPRISGHIDNLQCSPEIDIINIDGCMGLLSLVIYEGYPKVSIEINFTSISINSHIPGTVCSADKGM